MPAKGGDMGINGSYLSLISGWMLIVLAVCWEHSRAADSLNYDTAWTYVYDGGKTVAGKTMQDKFNDVKILSNGDAICVGQTQDSTYYSNVFLVRLAESGKELKRKSTINSMFEASDGRIITTAGDEFPNNNNQGLNNYAAYIEFDAQGTEVLWNEFVNTTGYEIAGWSIAPSQTGGGVLMCGKQSLFKIDTTANLVYKRQYNFSLPGVGTEVNNISRIHRLRSGPSRVAKGIMDRGISRDGLGCPLLEWVSAGDRPRIPGGRLWIRRRPRLRFSE
jgi:hypothetical protein